MTTHSIKPRTIFFVMAFLTIAYNQANADLYLGTFTESAVHKYSETNDLPVTPSSTLNVGAAGVTFTSGVTVDPQGNVYVSSLGTGQIFYFDSSGNPLPGTDGGATPGLFATLPEVAPGVQPAAAAIHWHADHIYVGDLYSNAVYRFGPEGGNTPEAAAILPVVDQPAAFTWGPNGNMFVAGYSTGTVYQFSDSTTSTDYISGGTLQQPGGLLFDPVSGNLLVSNTGSNSIDLYQPQNNFASGTFDSQFATSADLGTGPLGESNSPQDLIYSTDRSHILLALSGYTQQANGGSLVQFDLSGNPTTIEGDSISSERIAH